MIKPGPSVHSSSTSLFDTARTLPLLASLPEPVLARVLRGANMRRVKPGTVLFTEGEQAAHLHGIVSGLVELTTRTGDNDCGILVMARGDVFMPAAALFDEPYLNAARVLRPARLLFLDAGTLRGEAARCAPLSLALGRAIAGQFRMAVRHVIDLKCRSAGQRLAAFLLRIADDHVGAAPPRLPIAKRSLAVRLGMTAETLSRTLQTLAENGLVVRGAQILVRDRARIEAFCGPAIYPRQNEIELGVSVL